MSRSDNKRSYFKTQLLRKKNTSLVFCLLFSCVSLCSFWQCFTSSADILKLCHSAKSIKRYTLQVEKFLCKEFEKNNLLLKAVLFSFQRTDALISKCFSLLQRVPVVNMHIPAQQAYKNRFLLSVCINSTKEGCRQKKQTAFVLAEAVEHQQEKFASDNTKTA